MMTDDGGPRFQSGKYHNNNNNRSDVVDMSNSNTFYCPCMTLDVTAAEVLTYLVEAKEAQVSHNSQGTDPGPRGNLSRHLQTDLYDLQRIGENHLGSSCLQDETQKTPTFLQGFEV